MRSYEVSQPCPNCGATLDAVTAIQHNDAPKEESSITVCLYCGVVLAFTKGLALRRVPKRELRELDEKTRTLIERTRRRCAVRN